MIKSYRTELKPTKKQMDEINKTINACRSVYNKFIEVNKLRYKEDKKFLNHMKFSVWYNNEFIPQNEDKRWTKEVNTKATKQAMANAENAYNRFFNKTSGYPKYKKKQSNGSYYLIGAIHVESHRIKLPNLKWVKLKEKGYIPLDNIKSATVIKENDRYFVSVLIDEDNKVTNTPSKIEGIGVDLGLKDTLFTPKGIHITDLRKNKKLIKLNKSLKRQQRKLSKKQKKSNNWFRQLLKVQRLYRKIANIKKDIKQKKVLEIVKENPQFITIEDLNIKGMMKNRRVSNAFQQVGLGYIVEWLKWKCYQYGIELRQVDRFYPSSQICNQCGTRQPMPLNKRIYKCNNCGMIEDRDINASINLKQAKEYTILV